MRIMYVRLNKIHRFVLGINLRVAAAANTRMTLTDEPGTTYRNSITMIIMIRVRVFSVIVLRVCGDG